MSLLFSLLMKMDAGQAKTELRALQTEMTKAGGTAKVLGDGAKGAGTGIDVLGAKAGQAEAKLESVAAAQTRVAATAGQMQRANGAASAATGNLVAQFNDIGMMLMAGQNPLQLAIQQGTSITQVIGPMGASGAVKALGGALISMLSPINLVTLGVIGFGAAAIQWLSGAEEGAKSTADALTELDAATQKVRKSSQQGADELRKSYGELNSSIVEIEDSLRRIETVNAFKAQAAALSALKADTQGSWFAMFNDSRWDRRGQVASILGTDWRSQLSEAMPTEVANFVDAIDRLETAQGPREQLQLFIALRQQMELATGGIDLMDQRQLEFYGNIVNSEAALRQMVQAQQEAARAQLELSRAANTENARMGGPMAIDTPVGPSQEQRAADLAAATEMLGVLQAQSEMNVLIGQSGRESAAASLAKLQAEREAQAALVDSYQVSDAVKTELMQAWDAANGLARAQIAAAIEAALGPASRLNGILRTAAGWFTQINADASAFASAQQRLAADGKVYSGRGGDPRTSNAQGEGRFVYSGPSLDPFNNPVAKGGAGSGGGAAKAEADAVAELITKLREEQEVLRESDPVKQELLKYRKQLADATAAERAEVEALIRAEQQLKAIQEAEDWASKSAADFLDAIIVKGESAEDALKSLLSSLIKVGIQALMLGEGPLAGILGIKGGLFSGLFGGLGAKALATGGDAAPARLAGRKAIRAGDVAGFAEAARRRPIRGLITGDGGPRDDRVPAWLSPGEYIVNGQATARYRPVLERMNAGADIAGYASGGLVGAARGAGIGGFGGRGRPPVGDIHIHGAQGDAQIREMVAQGIKVGLTAYDRDVLPTRVPGILRDPRAR